MNAESLLSLLLGIGLSAACGFRVFVPLLVMSVASLSGNLNLASGFEWIGTYPALVAFGAATILEIAAYYVPWVDHILDIVATPAAMVAGVIVMASSIVGMNQLMRWTLAVIAGGGAAGMVQAFTGLARLTSTATTGGLGNPLVATAEAGGSVTLSLLAVLIPLAAGAVVLGLLLLIARRLLRKRAAKKAGHI